MKLILVNKKDKIIGYKDKKKCHQGKGILHRAFTAFVFNRRNQILIQKRSENKLLWPLFWETSCSGHPQKDQTYLETAKKRLKEELGFSCPLKLLGKFQYQAPYRDIGSENEVCAILVGKYYSGEIKPNPKEVASWKWIGVGELKKEMTKNPQKYTPWLKVGLKKLLSLGKDKRAPKLNSILDKYSKLIQPKIEKLLTSFVDRKFQGVVKYQILTGGKRLRPALAIISCQLLGGKIKDVLFAAAGLEILHNYTLIVDDVIDNSILRREKPTCWFKFGRSLAQCLGVDYSAAIFQAANLSKEPAKISELFAKTLKTIVDGEILDVLFEQKGRTDEPYVTKNRYLKITGNDYLKMAGKKTAFLFQTCGGIGGICAGAKKKEIEALRNFGFNFGLTFQISDDILDIFGDEEAFGKKIGKDIQERKMGNIVILLTLKELPEKGREKFLRIMRKEKINEKDVRGAIKLINQTNAHQRAYQFGEKFVGKAKENLKFLPKNKWNNLLREIADLVLERKQ